MPDPAAVPASPASPLSPAVPDQATRDRIAGDLSSTLFVEAGAGSGKTSALVGRVLALVSTGEVELRHVAAITFTDKAAAELRDRIRAALTARAASDDGSPESQRCRAALGQLDGAAIGTLHSFAHRILGEHPIEAGLPPRVEVLDEISSNVAFEQRWAIFQDQLLSDPTMERTLLLFFAAGARPEALRHLARAFDDDWDLVEDQVPAAHPEPPSARELLRPVLSAAEELERERCSDPADTLHQRIADVIGHLRRLERIGDELELLEALDTSGDAAPPSFKVARTGRKQSWDDVEDVRRRVAELGEQLAAVRHVVVAACTHRIAGAIRAFTLDAARARRGAGELQFHDLLVLARSLLRDPHHGPAVRARLHDRYRRLLLDELQDTDPIQIELAVRIAADDPRAASSGTLPWEQVQVTPGRLFMVGDPKQSIYRFRRADISTFLAAARRFGGGGDLVELTANFRTVEPVIAWVNTTFATLLDEPGDVPVPVPVPSQPGFVALDATRPAPPGGPAVSVLGKTPHPRGTPADELRLAEADDVAAAVARIVDEGWPVADRPDAVGRHPIDGAGTWRPATLGDITVLVPARTSLPFLEDALHARGIPFRAESSSLVYASRAVRDLLTVLRASDDPTNHLQVVSALRTPLLGCGDDDLFRFHAERGGRWSYLADQPGTVPASDPVRQGLEYLRSLHDERSWRSPSELLGRIALDRRALELGFAEGRPRDVWRRIRFVVDQARAWSEATGGNVRQYLTWVAAQTAEGARVAEAVLPETDDDAVRIMTIHSAKGLEFPIAIVSGMSSAPRGEVGPVRVVFPPVGQVGYRFSGTIATEEYRSWKPIDEQMDFHERIRLLYVACTRARDHLVVSLHRKERSAPPVPSRRTNAELLVDGMGDLLAMLPDAGGRNVVGPLPATPPPPPPPPYDEWLSERTEALERASRPGTVAATALTDEGSFDADAEPDPGLEKRPRDLDLPPWMKGRYGTAVGRAVHGVLQTVDLQTGAGMDAAVAAQCEAEAVATAGTVRRLVEAALHAPSVREAAASPHWREVYVCTPVDGRLIEGYVDLLYRSPAGLVVVDYKTAATSDSADLVRRLERYSHQGASYALSVAAATGEPVVRVTFLFLTPRGPVERDLPDIALAVRRARDLVASGREVLLS